MYIVVTYLQGQLTLCPISTVAAALNSGRMRGAHHGPAALRLKVARDHGWGNPRAPPWHLGGGRATWAAAQQSAPGSLELPPHLRSSFEIKFV